MVHSSAAQFAAVVLRMIKRVGSERGTLASAEANDILKEYMPSNNDTFACGTKLCSAYESAKVFYGWLKFRVHRLGEKLCVLIYIWN